MKGMLRFFSQVPAALTVVLIVSTGAAVAQETTAGLQGVMKDPSGGVIAKGTIEVSSPALIGKKKTETDLSGYYRFANLPPGTYTVVATATGFRTAKYTIELLVG